MKNKELRKEFRNTEIGKKLYKELKESGILLIVLIGTSIYVDFFKNFLFLVIIEFLYFLGEYYGAYKYFKSRS